MTLLELIVAVTVLGILSAIAIPTYNGIFGDSKDRAAYTSARTLAQRIDQYAASNALLPSEISEAQIDVLMTNLPSGTTCTIESGVIKLSVGVSGDTRCVNITPGDGTSGTSVTPVICGGGPTTTTTPPTTTTTTTPPPVVTGAAFGWGYNEGQLGDETRTNRGAPVSISGLTSITAISASLGQTCAIQSGAPYCTGYNYAGQLGNGTNTDSNVPVAVSTSGVLSGKTITAIAAGQSHTCAIASGAAYCWGGNFAGELGYGTYSTSNVPAAVDTSGVLAGKTVTSVATGQLHTCVVVGGAPYCWGDNSSKQLGDGTTTNRLSPVATDTSGVLSGKTVVLITGTGNHLAVLAT